jgi:integrase
MQEKTTRRRSREINPTFKELMSIKKPGYQAAGKGLYLSISATGTRSWVFRYVFAGKQREMGLGSLDKVGMADAREKASEARRKLGNGIDPLAERQRQREATQLEAAKQILFDDAASKYIEAHRAGWKNAKHADQWTNTLATYAFPVFGKLPVQDVDITLVLKVLEPIWTTKNETASRLRGRIESVLDWATVRGYRKGENPARWKGHLDTLLAKPSKIQKVEHHAALPYQEIGGFMAELAKMEGIGARALEFAILTAARSGEVRGATWSEIDQVAGIWTIPAERMKMNREHRVPLSTRALKLLEGMPHIGDSDLVFPGVKKGKPLSDMSLTAVLKRMGRADLTAHGFRSTFRDWAGDVTSYPRELAELCLAHRVGDQTEQAYRRGDGLQKRLRFMSDWAKYCSTVIPPASDNVVPIKRQEGAI